MEHNHQGKPNIYLILTAVLIIAALVCLGIFVKGKMDEDKANETYESLQEENHKSSEPDKTEGKEPGEEGSGASADPATGTGETGTQSSTEVELDPYEQSVKNAEDAGIPIPDVEVDIAYLQETVNPDIYAWLYVPETAIDYPVLQHPTDDVFYLEYNIDGSKGRPGCIYSEKKYNSKDFSDANTVLYGHNMRNGTMFATLHNYEDEDFFYRNRYIYIYTQDRMLVYKVFAAYEYSNEHLLYNNNFENPYDFCRFFMMAKARRSMHSIFDDEVELTGEGQHILTLSTCVTGKSDLRYLVQGILVNEE